MEPQQQESLDQQVQEALAELQAAGQPANIESVARRVGKRTADVLHSIRRLTGTSPAAPDADTPPETYPEVIAHQARVDRLTTALAEAEQIAMDADAALTQAELQAAAAVADGKELPSLVQARERALHAAERERLFGLALQVAKQRHAEALAQAQAAQQRVCWEAYQVVSAHMLTAGDAFAATQAEVMRCWNACGQPGVSPYFQGNLAVWETDFRALLVETTKTPFADRPSAMLLPYGSRPQPRAY